MVEERLGKYVEEQRDEDARQAKREGLAYPVTEWLNRRVEGSSYASKLSRNLGRADLKLKPGEYILIVVASIFLVGLVGYVIGQQSILLFIVGGLAGAYLPGMYVKSRQNRRLVKFGDQLADMLNLMVNGLRAGYSTMQAMEAVSKELPSPINEEFRRVVQEMQLGVTMERALANLLERVPSDDLDLVVTAINVQREVGGNLAEILDTISFTIRERVRIKGEIRVLTTQVMYSGRFLIHFAGHCHPDPVCFEPGIYDDLFPTGKRYLRLHCPRIRNCAHCRGLLLYAETRRHRSLTDNWRIPCLFCSLSSC